MFILENKRGDIIGWDLETGEDAWNYMDLLERSGINVKGVEVVEK